jgi:hypothetical protein
MVRLLISELFCGNFQGIVEICGKVVNVDTNNKNITIKGILILNYLILTILS